MLTRHFSDEHQVSTHPAGEFQFLRRDKVDGAVRYAISMRPNSPALKRTVSVNVRGNKAEVEAQLDMVEKAILSNALVMVTGTRCEILSI